MIDIATRDHGFDLLKVAYRFENLPYLVSDKFGNFFNLNHTTNKRTQPFKKLKTSKYRVNYNGIPYSLSTLRNINIKVNETIEI